MRNTRIRRIGADCKIYPCKYPNTKLQPFGFVRMRGNTPNALVLILRHARRDAAPNLNTGDQQLLAEFRNRFGAPMICDGPEANSIALLFKTPKGSLPALEFAAAPAAGVA